jgi:hypothetical protein
MSRTAIIVMMTASSHTTITGYTNKVSQPLRAMGRFPPDIAHAPLPFPDAV